MTLSCRPFPKAPWKHGRSVLKLRTPVTSSPALSSHRPTPGLAPSHLQRLSSTHSMHSATLEPGSTFQDHFQLKVQRQLDAIEAVREDLTTEGISVPGVVVVGAQSVGKSSVLESFSGIQLPRGETITTRVPLLLRLENHAAMEPGHVRAFISKAADMSQAEEVQEHEIAAKVRQYTEELAGGGGAVCDAPIHLKVLRRDSPNVTLIDLPGIAYCTADTSLTEDIAQLTKSLIDKYIRMEDMIIVVVVPAADDFASHEAIKMAAAHDPSGVRTLGVVTKTDRIETGKGFAAKMRAEGSGHIKLRLGYVAVKNRSQEEVDGSVPLEDARKAERRFFELDPRVRDLSRELWGMDTVIERIVEIQSLKVNETIPKIRKLVGTRIRDLEAAIEKLPPTFASPEARRAYFIDLVNKLMAKFRDLATTREIPSGEDAHLAVAAHAFERFQTFSTALKGSIPDFLSEDYRSKLAGMVKLTRGGSLSNFLSHPMFATCVKEGFIDPLAAHSEELVDGVQDYVIETFRCLLEVSPTGGLHGHPILEVKAVSAQLRQVLMQEVTEFTKDQERACREHISVRNSAEEFIFTLDEMYGKTIEDLKRDGERDGADGQMWGLVRQFFSGVTDAFVSVFREGDNEVKALCELQASLKAYVSIRSRTAGDEVSKLVRYFLVQLPMTQLARHLYASVPDARLAELMAEDAAEARERAKLTTSLERFKRARDVLKMV